MIDRNTTWRQGSLLKRDEFAMLGLEGGDDTCAVVISHDCDIPQDKESYLEVIVGQKVKKDKNFCSAKNVRRLHARFFAQNDDEFYVDLSFQNRQIIPRSDFAKLSGPCDSARITDADKRTLKQWLSVRYGRPAYPNAFENRLQRECRKKVSVEKGIAEAVSKRSEHIKALFFNLADERELELDEGTPYNLSVYVVYDQENGAVEARKEAEALAEEIFTLLRKVYGPPEDALDICVESCTALADANLSLADLMKIDQWRLEWVSLYEDSPDFLPTGRP
ncbi:hypothetical protein [Pseudomonas putida]